jgi:hypothetical protein
MVYELTHNSNSAATTTISTCNRASGRTIRSGSLRAVAVDQHLLCSEEDIH